MPQNENWFGYHFSEPRSQEYVTTTLTQRFGLPFEAADIAMTTGGFAAISSALFAVTDPGDEVIFSLPPGSTTSRWWSGLD